MPKPSIATHAKGGTIFVFWVFFGIANLLPSHVAGFLPFQPYPVATTTVMRRSVFSRSHALYLSSLQPTDEGRPSSSFAEHQQQLQEDLRVSHGDARQQVAAIQRFQRLAQDIYAQQLVEYQDILERLAVLTARADQHQRDLLLQQQQQQQEAYRHQEQASYSQQELSSPSQEYAPGTTYQPEGGEEQVVSYQEPSYDFGSEEGYQLEQQTLNEKEEPLSSYSEDGVIDQQEQPYEELRYASFGSEEQPQPQQQYEFDQPNQLEYEEQQYQQEQMHAQENEWQSTPNTVTTAVGDKTASDILAEMDALTVRATELVAEREQQQLELQQLPTTAIEISQTPPEAATMLSDIPFQLEEMEDADTCTSEILLNADFTVTVGETDGPIYKEATGTWSAMQIPNIDDTDSQSSTDNVDKRNSGMFAVSMSLVRHYQAGHEAIESTDVGEFSFAVARNFIGTLTYVGDRLSIAGTIFIEDEIFGDDEIGYFNMIDTSPREGDDDDAWKPAKVGRFLRQS